MMVIVVWNVHQYNDLVTGNLLKKKKEKNKSENQLTALLFIRKSNILLNICVAMDQMQIL